jgi:diaminohydroxyphosphoribosylaminopyrimidine deaminase/5-amino-6-(5-phosphoribosylamino)uracil reductase
MDSPDQAYMQRCLELAKRGGKKVRPNPMVGALLVHRERIIGEGWHEQFGGPHAEVNCLASVRQSDRRLIQDSTLYVSLEPCSFFGKTPACTTLILKNKIRRVVLGTLDPNPKVNGMGVAALKERGIEVVTGVLDQQARDLIRTFRVNQLKKRPYIILKIVQSKYGYVGIKGKRIWLSNPYSTLLSHKWRSEVDGIMAGTGTLLNDDPALDNRLYPGESPVRIVADRQNRLSPGLRVLDGSRPTLLFREKPIEGLPSNTRQIPFDFKKDRSLPDLLGVLFNEGIHELLVEGGSNFISSFLQTGLWDEARIIRTSHDLSTGVKAPNVTGRLNFTLPLGKDRYEQVFHLREMQVN